MDDAEHLPSRPPPRVPLRYLVFERSEGDEGVATLEALACTLASHHATVVAEAQQVLAWACLHFAHSQGPADEGMDWDHDLQLTVQDGRWFAVSLTLTGSPRFVDAFMAVFGTDDS